MGPEVSGHHTEKKTARWGVPGFRHQRCVWFGRCATARLRTPAAAVAACVASGLASCLQESLQIVSCLTAKQRGLKQLS